MKTIKYLKYVLIHKWYVFKFCCKYGIIWRGIVHDISKLCPSEFIPYRNYFYGKKYRDELINNNFNIAWNHHQKHNKHHWQYWVLKLDSGGTEALEMPLVYRKECVSDWAGASMAIRGFNDTIHWYSSNKDKMILGTETREWIEQEIGFKQEKI